MNAGQRHVGRNRTRHHGSNDRPFMLIIRLQYPVDGRAVSAKDRAWFHDLAHERLDAGRRFPVNLLKPNTAKAFRRQDFDGNDYDSLGRSSFRALAPGSLPALANRKIALIDLDDAF